MILLIVLATSCAPKAMNSRYPSAGPNLVMRLAMGNYTGNENGELTFHLELRNSGDSPARVRVPLEFFHGEVVVRTGGEIRVFRHWQSMRVKLFATFSPKEIVLLPNQSIEYVIRLLDDFVLPSQIVAKTILDKNAIELRRDANRRVWSMLSLAEGFEVCCVLDNRSLVSNVLVIP